MFSFLFYQIVQTPASRFLLRKRGLFGWEYLATSNSDGIGYWWPLRYIKHATIFDTMDEAKSFIPKWNKPVDKGLRVVWP